MGLLFATSCILPKHRMPVEKPVDRGQGKPLKFQITVGAAG
jgi:hypothetical protein